MKEGIHPKYDKARFECVCGNVIETRSTRSGTIKVDICSACHPFFTGKAKLLDTAGRVERFYRKYKDHYDKLEQDKKQEQPKES